MFCRLFLLWCLLNILTFSRCNHKEQFCFRYSYLISKCARWSHHWRMTTDRSYYRLLEIRVQQRLCQLHSSGIFDCLYKGIFCWGIMPVVCHLLIGLAVFLYDRYLPTVILRPLLLWVFHHPLTLSLYSLNAYFSANPPYRSLSFFFFRIYYMDFPDCLLLLLSISVSFLFSFFSVSTLFQLSFPCGRLSWLMSAFERTLK